MVLSAVWAWVHNDISSRYGISYHIVAVHQMRNQKHLVPKMYLFISYIVRLITRTHRKMRWISVGKNVHSVFERKDPQTNALDYCCLKRQRYYRDSITSSCKEKTSQQKAAGVSTEYGFTSRRAQKYIL